MLVLLLHLPQKSQITLTVVVDDQGDTPRALNMFFKPALQELKARHAELT